MKAVVADSVYACVMSAVVLRIMTIIRVGNKSIAMVNRGFSRLRSAEDD
jgi:hypothetical protein